MHFRSLTSYLNHTLSSANMSPSNRTLQQYRPINNTVGNGWVLTMSVANAHAGLAARYLQSSVPSYHFITDRPNSGNHEQNCVNDHCHPTSYKRYKMTSFSPLFYLFWQQFYAHNNRREGKTPCANAEHAIKTYNNFFWEYFVPKSVYCKKGWNFTGLRPRCYQQKHKYM